jgi:hypothetical protein
MKSPYKMKFLVTTLLGFVPALSLQIQAKKNFYKQSKVKDIKLFKLITMLDNGKQMQPLKFYMIFSKDIKPHYTKMIKKKF